MARPILLSWSSGKDSAWALHVLGRRDDVEVVGLLTTINEARDRVAMHAVRRALLEAQARAAGLPLWPVAIPEPCTNEAYERAMGAAVARARAEGVEAVAFGDLFLDEVRAYRERQMEGSGLECLFPLWGEPTGRLARAMVDGGLVAYLTCVDTEALEPDYAGRRFDRALLEALPEGVDPCGEHGEFHSVVVEGPMLAAPIPVALGERVVRGRFAFVDVVPGGSASPRRRAR